MESDNKKTELHEKTLEEIVEMLGKVGFNKNQQKSVLDLFKKYATAIVKENYNYITYSRESKDKEWKIRQGTRCVEKIAVNSFLKQRFDVK